MAALSTANQTLRPLRGLSDAEGQQAIGQTIKISLAVIDELASSIRMAYGQNQSLANRKGLMAPQSP